MNYLTIQPQRKMAMRHILSTIQSTGTGMIETQVQDATSQSMITGEWHVRYSGKKCIGYPISREIIIIT